MQNPFDPGYYTEDEARTFGFKSVGRNVRIAKNAQIIGLDRITIGDNVRIDGFTNIIAAGGPGVTIGSYIHIGAYCHFSGSGGGVTLRDFVNLSQGVRIYSGSDDYSGESLTSPMTPKHLKKETIGPVVIGRHVIIGSGTVVLPDLEIGDHSAVGALSLVSKTLAPWGIYAGVPARYLRDRSRKLLELEAQMRAEQG
jgi:galactoside O-acetyltransferase